MMKDSQTSLSRSATNKSLPTKPFLQTDQSGLREHSWADSSYVSLFIRGFSRLEFKSLHELQEANKDVIELHEDASITAVMTMFKHLYGLNYEKQEMPTHITDVVGFHLEVFMLGDKYDISSLRVDAAARFIQALQREIRSDYLVSIRDPTIYAIRRLLGPHAVHLADQSLTTSVKDLVFKNSTRFFSHRTFRKLLGTGNMLDIELGVEFMDKIHREWLPMI
jgi:hypothetical protein